MTTIHAWGFLNATDSPGKIEGVATTDVSVHAAWVGLTYHLEHFGHPIDRVRKTTCGPDLMRVYLETAADDDADAMWHTIMRASDPWPWPVPETAATTARKVEA